MRVRLRQCDIADADHEESRRSYAHTLHYQGNVICVAEAFFDLPENIQIGLIAHELGHLKFPDETDEYLIDKIGGDILGVEIYRIDSSWGNNLQTV